ncbi:hypothetical protein HK101_002873 [Irineochytrium annulatum]|nr:hypothetical protein HK101_002873 [Irineochytrium annulatum]
MAATATLAPSTTPMPSSLPMKAGTNAAMFTCLACHVAFYSADNQRDHYRSDWHRYNLKRKVTDLPPITQEMFVERLQAQQAKTNADTARSTFQATCRACQKTYSSENAYENHMTSRKHKEAVEAFERAAREGKAPAKDDETEKLSKPASAPTAAAGAASSSSASTATPAAADAENPEAEQQPSSINWRVRLAQARTETELQDLLTQKVASSPSLPIESCIFCPHASATLQDSLNHMAAAHSFFVPDLEYIVDLAGLVRHLLDKVAVGNVCLYCNGRGRGFFSLEAVRGHMVDKGHCKMRYEDGEEEEVADFYDFSKTWDVVEGEGQEWEDVDDEDEEGGEEGDEVVDLDEQEDEDLDEPASAVHLSNNSTRLHLASGAVVAHRAHRPRGTATRSASDALMITRLQGKYASLNVSGRSEWAVRRVAEVDAKRQNREVERRARDFKMRVGVRGNKGDLNKHFRSQIGFD